MTSEHTPSSALFDGIFEKNSCTLVLPPIGGAQNKSAIAPAASDAKVDVATALTESHSSCSPLAGTSDGLNATGPGPGSGVPYSEPVKYPAIGAATSANTSRRVRRASVTV